MSPLAVVLINQVTTKVGHQGSAYIAPALGESWSHLCSSRIMLSWEAGCRLARLVKSTTFRCVLGGYRGCRKSACRVCCTLHQCLIPRIRCCWQVRDRALPNHRRRRPRLSPQTAACPRRLGLGRLCATEPAHTEQSGFDSIRGSGRPDLEPEPSGAQPSRGIAALNGTAGCGAAR